MYTPSHRRECHCFSEYCSWIQGKHPIQCCLLPGQHWHILHQSGREGKASSTGRRASSPQSAKGKPTATVAHFLEPRCLLFYLLSQDLDKASLQMITGAASERAPEESSHSHHRFIPRVHDGRNHQLGPGHRPLLDPQLHQQVRSQARPLSLRKLLLLFVTCCSRRNGH